MIMSENSDSEGRIRISTGELSQNVNENAEHILFVEGEDHSIDVSVVRKLVPAEVMVRPMGNSNNLKRMAKALHKLHPKYCFIVDRDHHSDVEVEDFWETFLDSSQPNLLMWKLREIENYFLFPEFLEKSRYLIVNPSDLKMEIQKEVRKNLVTDLANQAIRSTLVGKRPKFRKIELDYPTNLKSPDQICHAIENNQNLKDFIASLNLEMTVKNITKKFFELIEEVEYEDTDSNIFSNKFMKYVKGSEVLRKIVKHPFFDIEPEEKKTSKIDKIIYEVVTSILDDQNNFPKDFLDVQKIIIKHINM